MFFMHNDTRFWKEYNAKTNRKYLYVGNFKKTSVIFAEKCTQYIFC